MPAQVAPAVETVGRRRRTVSSQPHPLGPSLGEPVVIDGRKYRVKVYGAEAPGKRPVVTCRTYHGGLEALVPVAALAWDGEAGLWLAPSVGPWAQEAPAETVARARPTVAPPDGKPHPDVAPMVETARAAVKAERAQRNGSRPAAVSEPEPSAETAAAAAETVAPVAPVQEPGQGTCSEHIYSVLVSRRSLGIRTSYWDSSSDRLLIVCPDPAHGEKRRGYRGEEPPFAALRCAWCGDALYPTLGPDDRGYDVNARKAYCTDNHRLLAFRDRRRNGGASSATVS